ncbi:Bug family tripartite tricarboxylate transporter substrate binding protein [Ramlibacter tataouinensis]|uniref:Candidate extracytoplasmic binding receptor n=1 Tax=Ramlibacter tataouinensis (strain ATCC BAA-407 / DSM 14655 / LMG 21543 / TTB310) TaxID=365046 RepID=F5Y676_RAMTT|nr:tripartite tricarboxylate transporter substrate binding protein [Ramlibacter tataouinensis]AEG92762.1 Candidate extracytoplasmic binding receptor [Ramlibacter tataouinensis TTB310]
MDTKRTFLAAALLAAAGLAGGPAAAQDAAAAYPGRPIRMIVNFPPGGTVDVLTRTVAQKLSERWGQPVLVDNRPGAGGNIGAQAVAAAEPDGYTLLATPPGPLAINQNLYRDMRYDPAALVPVVLMASVPNVITARADLPVNSVKELVAYARAHPGKVTYGSQGSGSTSHLTGQMFATMTGTELVHVPFKGEGPALTELLGGRVDLFFGNVSAVLKFQQARQVKLLALASPRRGSMAPEVPSAVEAGLPDFVASAWFAIAAPPGTPAPIAVKLNAAVLEVMKMPDVQQKFAAQGAEVVGGTPADMTAFVEAERARWKKVIVTANVKVD